MIKKNIERLESHVLSDAKDVAQLATLVKDLHLNWVCVTAANGELWKLLNNLEKKLSGH